MEVSDHEIGRMQHDVDRGLGKEETADAAADEHGNESQRKQRSGIDTQLGAVEAANPDQHDDRRRNGDRQRGERKRDRRKRIHPAHEHVMSVDHVAEKRERHHGINNDPMA